MRKKKEKVEEKVEKALPIPDPNVCRGDQRERRVLIPLFGTTLRLVEIPGSRRCQACFSAKEAAIGFDGDTEYCKDCVLKHGDDLTFQSLNRG